MIKCDNVQTEVLKNIVEERIRQDKKWGIQSHNFDRWFSILGEEFGEIAKEINKNPNNLYNEDLIYDLTQVAAVCVAWLEYLERNK